MRFLIIAILVNNAGRKPAWFVFQAFGTDREDEVFEFAKDIIGIDDWDQVIYKAPIPMRPELND